MANRNRKTAADRAFDRKVKEACAAHDWNAITTIFNQYGHYLELVDATPVTHPSQEETQHAEAPADS